MEQLESRARNIGVNNPEFIVAEGVRAGDENKARASASALFLSNTEYSDAPGLMKR